MIMAPLMNYWFKGNIRVTTANQIKHKCPGKMNMFEVIISFYSYHSWFKTKMDSVKKNSSPNSFPSYSMSNGENHVRSPILLVKLQFEFPMFLWLLVHQLPRQCHGTCCHGSRGWVGRDLMADYRYESTYICTSTHVCTYVYKRIRMYTYTYICMRYTSTDLCIRMYKFVNM